MTQKKPDPVKSAQGALGAAKQKADKARDALDAAAGAAKDAATAFEVAAAAAELARAQHHQTGDEKSAAAWEAAAADRDAASTVLVAAQEAQTQAVNANAEAEAHLDVLTRAASAEVAKATSKPGDFALRALKEGHRLRRDSWREGAVIYMDRLPGKGGPRAKLVMVAKVGDTPRAWHPKDLLAELMAEDWEVIPA